MKVYSALLGCAFSLVAAADDGVVAIRNSSFGAGKDGLEGWSADAAMTVRPGAGVNGSPGLVLTAGKTNAVGRCSQYVSGLMPGKRYLFGCSVRTDADFTSPTPHGAKMCIDWYDEKGKWIAEAQSSSVTKPGTDWTLCSGTSVPMPPNARQFSVLLYCGGRCTGTAYYDNVFIRRADRPVVCDAFSSAYRNVAASGSVDFLATVNLPDGLTAKDVDVAFVCRSADGKDLSVPGAVVGTREARASVEVASLASGTNAVRCVVRNRADGKTLGSSEFAFARVGSLPKRKVYLDEHKRLIVDGQPFFPLGLYSSAGIPKDDPKKMLETYAKSPFNCAMPYGQLADWQYDRYQELGVKLLVGTYRGCFPGGEKAKRWNLKTQEEIDARVTAEVTRLKDHPAILGWYIFDEPPLDEKEPLCHVQRLFERIDPDHPTWGVLDVPENFIEFRLASDVIGCDPYPIPEKPIREALDHARLTSAATFGRRATWNVPQTFSWGWINPKVHPKGRMPTREEFRALFWQHIAGGANGLVGYIYWDFWQYPPEAMPMYRTHWDNVCAAAEEVKKCIPILLSVEPVPTVKGDSPEMGVRAWVKDGDLYVLAVNPERKAVVGVLEAEGVAWAPAGVVVGAGSVRPLGPAGKFRVDLPALGAAMFRFRQAECLPAEVTEFVTKPHDLDVLLEAAHVQGACCDETGFYLSYACGVTKFDWKGEKVGEMRGRAHAHLGDSAVADGRLYVVYGLHEPVVEGTVTNWGMIAVHDAKTFKLLKARAVREPLDGCTVLKGIVYTSPDRRTPTWPKNKTTFIQRFDLELDDLGITEVDLGFPLTYGVQTMDNDGESIYCCCYAGPDFDTARLTPDLKVQDRFLCGGSEGFGLVPASVATFGKDRLYFATAAFGGGAKGWKADPQNNPPRERIIFRIFKDGRYTLRGR